MNPQWAHLTDTFYETWRFADGYCIVLRGEHFDAERNNGSEIIGRFAELRQAMNAVEESRARSNGK